MDSFIHPIAKNYFNTIELAGGNVADKRSVNAFVWGLSRIVHPSLWVCWPLRSTQNIGTGTTAFSLGGLGNFPGTLVNGPTWSLSGLSIGTTGYVSTELSFSQSIDNYTGGLVCSLTTCVSNGRLLGSISGVNTVLYTGGTDVSNVIFRTFFGGSLGTPLLNSNLTSPTMLTISKTNLIVSGHINQTLNNTTSPTQVTATSYAFSLFGSSTGNAGVVPFWFYFPFPLTASQISTIYNLYKNTLGQGLGLL